MQSLRTVLVLLSTLAGTSAQINGVCSCSPSTFIFTLDFTLSCPPTLLGKNAGLLETACNISPLFDRNITDLVPVAATQIQILELDRSAQILDQLSLTGEYATGATIPYSSLSADGVETEADVPGSIQVSVTASNANGGQLLLVWIAKYSNACDAYPLFSAGESAGWIVVTAVTPPLAELCPAAPQPSPVTVSPVTTAPVSGAPITTAPMGTAAPVTVSTVAPVTVAPITPATVAPVTLAPAADTVAPVTLAPAADTVAPVSPSTVAPVTGAPVSESFAPVAPPTVAPVTGAPVSESFAPVAPFTVAPVSGPPVTFAPVAPTDAPVSPVVPTTYAPIVSTPAPLPIDTLEPTELDCMSMSMDFYMDIDLDDMEFGRKGKSKGGKAEKGCKQPKGSKGSKGSKKPKARKGGDTDTLKIVKAPKADKSSPSEKKGKKR